MGITARLLLLSMLALAATANAQPAGHSVEAIKKALTTPISEELAAKAHRADDEILRSGSAQGQRVTLVTDAYLDRTKRVMGRLLQVMKQNPDAWTIRVLDTSPKTENAFVYGRNVYVYTGLLQGVQSEDELAVVLSHEIGHTYLHQLERRDGDSTHTIASLIELGGALAKKDNLSLVGGALKAGYSRIDEQEADAFGVYLAKRSGYDPLKGADFFARMVRQGDSAKAQNDQQIATARANITAQMANCQRMRSQWNSNPLVRTRQNEQTINSTCQTAEANAQKFNAALSAMPSQTVRNELLKTHPADNERIAAIAAASDFFAKRRPLNSLSGIGGGYNVYVAMSQLAAEARARGNGDSSDSRPPQAPPAVQPAFSPSVFYAASSRHAGETCNSNSDCVGSSRCSDGLCTAE